MTADKHQLKQNDCWHKIIKAKLLLTQNNLHEITADTK